MVALTVMTLLVVGLVSTNILGLIIYQSSENTLTASDSARIAFGKMTDEIRNAQSVLVGNLTDGVFTGLTAGETLTGGALMIYPTTNTTSYVVYFVNAADQSFRRTTSVTATTQILAESVTNLMVFTAQDYLGNVLTNSQNNQVIHACLEINDPPGTAPTAESYKLETSATRRTF